MTVKMMLVGGAAAVAVILGGPGRAAAQEPWEQKIDVMRSHLHDAAQQARAGLFVAREADVLEIEPLVPRAGVRNAPFTAEAITEFTQTLGDGNRIERTFTTTIARDSRGRTRREQEVAMVGPLATLQDSSPRLVIISDAEAGADYTLDEQTRIATKNAGPFQIRSRVKGPGGDVVMVVNGAVSLDVKGDVLLETMVNKGAGRGVVHYASAAAARVTTEQLGAKMIEGVAADGIRTTTTIPAGAVGNVNPIEAVTERWWSKDLQMEVLITRRDPRAGDTTYRLTNIVRAEPPADLFVVPHDYTVHQPGKMVQKVELKQVQKAEKVEKADK